MGLFSMFWLRVAAQAGCMRQPCHKRLPPKAVGARIALAAVLGRACRHAGAALAGDRRRGLQVFEEMFNRILKKDIIGPQTGKTPEDGNFIMAVDSVKMDKNIQLNRLLKTAARIAQHTVAGFLGQPLLL